MNWEAIGAIGEIVGAVAVIATLIYLAQQIKQQNASAKISMYESVVEGFNNVNASLADDERIARLFNTGLWHPDELTNDQASQFSWIVRRYMNQFLKVYRLRGSGIFPDEDWSDYVSQAAFLANTPGGKLFIDGQGSAFRGFLEEIRSAKTDDLAVDFSLGRTRESGGA